MKTEDLKSKGLSDEQISFVMSENGKDIKREQDKAAAFKTQLETATATLKTFEGVNVEELRTKIATLTNDLAAQTAAHEKELADRDFGDTVKKYAEQFKARDVRAVMPFLDVEKLKTSKNQESDIKAAFEAVKKEQGYLFKSDDLPRAVSFTKGPDKSTDNPTTKANDALRALFAEKGE